MALTKVSGGILDPGINVAGIVTATGFDGPFTGGTGSNINAGIITATGFDLNGNGDISGNLVIGGNLTANGDFTTLNTTLREVEILRVDANTTAVAGIITQRGSGDILNLFDNSTEVFTVKDGGNVGINSTAPTVKLDVNGTAKFNDDITLNGANFDITYDRSLNTVNFDQSFLKFGTSGQLVLRSSGAFSTIDSTAGLKMTVSSLEVLQTSGDKMIKTYNNGAVELYHDDHLSFTTNANGITLKAPEGGDCVLDMNADEGDDNPDKWRLNVTQGGSFQLKNYADGSWENHIQTTVNSSVELYNNGIKQCETYSAGLDIVPGKVLRVSHANATDGNDGTISSGVFNEGLTLVGTQTVSGNGRKITHYGDIKPSNNNGTSLGSSSNQYGYLHCIRLIARYDSNSTGLYIGASDDIRSYHDGTDSWLTNKTGNFRIGNTHNDEIKFLTQGNTRWNIDGSGHFVPDTAGAVNIGSASAEIGNVYLADSKNIYIGSDQDVYFNHSGVHAQIKNTTGNFYFDTELTHYIRLGSSNEAAITATHNGSVDLYYDGGTYTTPKLKTSATGITVDGEVAASQDYPNY